MKMQKPRLSQRDFGVIAILLLCASLSFYLAKAPMNKKSSDAKEITAVLTGVLNLPISPENISTIPLYQIHLNLWDTLLTSRGGPALTRLIDTSEGGRVYHFEIEPGSSFSNGRKITSEDIIFSINRLMHEQPGGHFNAKNVIERIDKTSDARFSIRLKETTPAFLFLLSIPEMGIVPKEATDSQGKVVNLKVTSGAYVVSGAPQPDRIVLVKNPYFRRSGEHSPEQVTVLFRRTAESLTRAPDEDHADFLEFYESGGTKAFQKLKGNSDLTYALTRPSCSVFLSTDSKRLSTKERQALSALVNEKRAKFVGLQPEIEQFSNEILPPNTFASLGKESPPAAHAIVADLPKKLIFGVHDKTSPLAIAMVNLFTESGIRVELVDIKDNSQFDISLLGQGMNADFPEIEFYLSILSPWAFISEGKNDRELISRALHMADQKKRAELLQQVGKGLLDDGRIIPLVVRSYVHMFRKNRLSVDQVTNYDGDVPFWKMRVN